MKKNTTKRSLLASLLALAMCVTMLVGTTFAWFTDSASVSVSKIEAGKLDIDVFYADTADGSEGSNWTLLTKDSNPLSFLRKQADGTLAQDASILWEPNCTYSLPALKIVNNGNLALKYKVLITGLQGDSELNDVIEWTMKLGNDAFVMGSEHSLAAKTGDTVASDILTIQGHMDADAGNKYQGMTIQGVSITVLATQDTVENDSKDNQYDKDAPYEIVKVSDEKELRTALYNAPTDGRGVKIVLQDDITLEMLYSPTLFSHSNEAGTWKSHGMTDEEAAAEAAKPENGVVADSSTQYNTLTHYKIGVMPTAENPSQWNPIVSEQTLEERAQFGAYIHAGDTRCARLVVKAGQDVILDLNGKTLAKRADAAHGTWDNTDTDIIANYGLLKITDSTGSAGTVKGNGFFSCGGAVLHNFSGAVMTVEKVNIDGNAENMTNIWTSKHSGQYVISNEGGTVVIDGANVYDTHPDVNASLVVNTSGTMTIKGGATLNHPTTKAVNVKGGKVLVENATIFSDKYAVYAAKGTAEVNKANVTVIGTGTMTEDGGTIIRK